MCKAYSSVISLLLISLPAYTQTTRPSYPQDYFRNPLDIPIFLAGNFGECRPGHFHSGIDIKTKGEENQPVHAAAEGYISRIKMEKGGFGHGLYITHPNGYTTLYAHLNDFSPAIQKYVRTKQYEKKAWNIDLQLSPSQFPVTKGQQVAWSGNTGASTAPHLHFEIRNTKTEHPLNPEQFGLPIVDKIPPAATEVAFYSGNIYDAESAHPHILSLQKTAVGYKPLKFKNDLHYGISKDTVLLEWGNIGLALNVDDYMNGSDNSLTFYKATIRMDDSVQVEVTLDDIGYDETRYINAYTDYRSKKQKGRWFQLFFQQPGNRLGSIYTRLNAARGLLSVEEGSTHKINISIADDMGNVSDINFYIKGAVSPLITDYPQLTPFYANKPNKFADPNVTLSLDEKQLYDDINFKFESIPFSDGYSDKYQLHYPWVPVHHYLELMVKPTRPIPFNLRQKVVLMYSDGKETEGSSAEPVDGGWYKTNVRSLGTYWLNVDTIPPVIKSMQQPGAILSKAKQITFTAKDAVTSVKRFSGYLDDSWICFEQHGNSFFYKFDEHCSKGKHILEFKAEDENGNAASQTLTFIR